MDPGLKQRLVGAAVLVALAVIFLPMLVKGPAPDSGVSDVPLELPDRPREPDTVTRELPLVAPRPPSGEGALGLGARPRDGGAPADGALPMVDTAQAQHPDAAQLAGDADAVAGTGEPGDAPASGQEPAPAHEPEPQAAAALPATTAGGGYAVRFGSYAGSDSADTVVGRLRDEGFPASSSSAQVAGQRVWRVQIGPYASRAQAEAVRVRAAQIRPNDAQVVALDAEPARAASTTAPAQAAAPATPPAVPAAAADVGFVVQLGAFANAAEATAMRDRLRALGFSAFTDTVNTDRGLLTRVKAGPVVSRAEAERLKSQISDRASIDGMVRSHP